MSLVSVTADRVDVDGKNSDDEADSNTNGSTNTCTL